MKAPHLLIILLLAITCAAIAAPAPSLFADRIARNVGDIITIEIVENSVASASARTNTKSEYDAKVSAGGTGALDFIPLLGADGSTKSEHKGDGRTSRQGSLRATLTAKVVEVLPNGNMRIEGEKNLIINGERQVTVLKGIIRPEDVSPQNIVSSDMIADAEITFKGKGILANTERPGFFARLLNWLF
jgi:flagellar L-ring protein precursor FlgH